MIQTRDNRHRHTTHQVAMTIFVRPCLRPAIATIDLMTVSVACKKEAAP
jgi:hypothetical protein